MKKLTSWNPFRWQGMLLFLAVFGPVVGGYLFFFDRFLKTNLEKVASAYNLAPVTMRALQTSFSRATFEVDGLEWVDATAPEYNLFEVGAFRSSWRALPLLQKKGYFETVSVLDFGLQVKRNTPAQLPQGKRAPGENLITQSAKKLVTQSAALSKQLGSVIQNQAEKKLAAVQTKVKQQISAQQRALAEQKRALEAKYEVQLRSLVNAFPVQQSLTELQNFEVKSLTEVQSVSAARQQIEKVRRLAQSVKQVKPKLKKLESSFAADSRRLRKQLSGAERWVQQGRAQLVRYQQQVVSPEGLTEQLFGGQLLKVLPVALRLYDRYGYLIPSADPAQAAQEAAAAARRRALKAGREIHYRRSFDPPAFFIEQLNFSSKGLGNGIKTGVLKNVSSDLSYRPLENDLRVRYNNFLVDLKGKIEKQKNGKLRVMQAFTFDKFSLLPLLTINPNPYVEKLLAGEAFLSGTLNLLAAPKSSESSVEELRAKLRWTGENLRFRVKPQSSKALERVLRSLLQRVKRVEVEVDYVRLGEKIEINIRSDLDTLIKARLGKFWEALRRAKQRELLRRYEREMNRVLRQGNEALAQLEISGLKPYLGALTEAEELSTQLERQLRKVEQEERKRLEAKLRKEAGEVFYKSSDEEKEALRKKAEEIGKNLKGLFR